MASTPSHGVKNNALTCQVQAKDGPAGRSPGTRPLLEQLMTWRRFQLPRGDAALALAQFGSASAHRQIAVAGWPSSGLPHFVLRRVIEEPDHVASASYRAWSAPHSNQSLLRHVQAMPHHDLEEPGSSQPGRSLTQTK